MKKIQTKGSLNISSPSYGDGRQVVSLQVEDSLSGNTFLELEIPYEDFTKALMRFRDSDSNCDITLRALDLVGKKRHRSDIIGIMPDEYDYYKRDEVAYEACKKALGKPPEDGSVYIISPYFGSKGSFFTKGGVNYCKTTLDVYKEI